MWLNLKKLNQKLILLLSEVCDGFFKFLKYKLIVNLILEIFNVISRLVILYYLEFRMNCAYFFLQLERQNGSSFPFSREASLSCIIGRGCKSPIFFSFNLRKLTGVSNFNFNSRKLTCSLRQFWKLLFTELYFNTYVREGPLFFSLLLIPLSWYSHRFLLNLACAN